MPERRLLRTVVESAEWISPRFVRVVVGGPDLEDFAVGEFTDHYVKLRLEKVRTYTVRDFADGRLTLDFVVHGDAGVAGPWAAAARPGDVLELTGPGGGYAPAADADWHLMVGDESVLPAIAVSLARVPAGVPVLVVVESDDDLPLSSPGDLEVRRLHRPGAPGASPELLLDAVRALELPPGRGQAFVHGEATAVRLVRRHLLVDRGFDPAAVSASGYWKLRRTDEQWRSEKAEWKQLAEADTVLAAPPP
jgi:NADPH-dependent ferric siderophore reductase